MYDEYFVSTINHIYKNDKDSLLKVIDEAFKTGTDFQKAYCSGLEDFLISQHVELEPHEHYCLEEMVMPPMVRDGYSRTTPIDEFIRYNVWVTSIGEVA